ncbi:MAG TPA: histidine kinase, partial [Alcanivorax sp.]|nr:histidine kinase [Alcanivorax sp.]
QGNRMALDNIRHRLEALHGPSVSVSARSQQQHYEIEISYPLQ